MASRFLRAHHETRHGRFYQWSERLFDRMLHAYERGLDLALRWKRTTLCIFFATLALSVYLFVIIPKGFFPQQDNGFLTGVSEASQDISFAEHEAASGGAQRDRPGRSRRRQHRDVHRRRRHRAQFGAHVHHAEAARRARRRRAADHRAAAAEAREGRGRQALSAGLAGRPARRPRHPHAVRVHAAGRQSRRAERMGAEDPRAGCRRCRSCATSPPTSRPRARRCS